MFPISWNLFQEAPRCRVDDTHLPLGDPLEGDQLGAILQFHSWDLRPPGMKGLPKLGFGGQLPGQAHGDLSHMASVTPPADSLEDSLAGEFSPSRGYHSQPVP